MKPLTNDKSRVCLNFNVDGLTAFCNHEALIDLRNQLDWLIASQPEDHYHCHVLLSLENEESMFEEKRPRNAGVSFSEGFEKMAEADFSFGTIVDLTFQVVTDSDLDNIQSSQK